MKSCLLTVALLLSLGASALLPNTAAASAKDDKEKMDPEAVKQEVWDMQVKIGMVAIAAVGLAVGACWLLSNSNERKKKYLIDLRKGEHLDPNEGMQIN